MTGKHRDPKGRTAETKGPLPKREPGAADAVERRAAGEQAGATPRLSDLTPRQSD